MALRASREFQAEVKQEIASLRTRLEKLKTLESLLAELLGNEDDAPMELPVSEMTGTRKTSALAAMLASEEPSHTESESRSGTWKERVESVLRAAAGKPLTVLQIVDALGDMGYETDKPRSSLYNSVYTALTRNSPQFIQVGANLWRLKSSM
jgi:hypothetical protein